jgi:hypothetical protein
MNVETLSKAILPEEIEAVFRLEDIKDEPEATVFVLVEKQELIPKELAGKETVLDGFCNPLERLHFPIKGKKLYLRLYRRRWKEKNTNEHYSNPYQLHDAGMKATQLFGAFLKATI